jgi:hypothetical protein
MGKKNIKNAPAKCARLYSEERLDGISLDPYREGILLALKEIRSQNEPN